MKSRYHLITKQTNENTDTRDNINENENDEINNIINDRIAPSARSEIYIEIEETQINYPNNKERQNQPETQHMDNLPWNKLWNLNIPQK